MTHVMNTTSLLMADPDGSSMVRDEEAFQEMRSHILNHYDGVVVTHSFLKGGRHFDCITIESQPSVRDHDSPVSTSPPTLPGGANPPPTRRRLFPPEDPLGVDSAGDVMSCPSGSIPMHRLDLDRLMNFATLYHLFAKHPSGPSGSQPLSSPGSRRLDADSHKYAHAPQSVSNYGGRSVLGLWTQPMGPFSLSQMWYTANPGDDVQTAEGGWVYYPAHSSADGSVPFIYHTTDGYKQGTGC